MEDQPIWSMFMQPVGTVAGTGVPLIGRRSPGYGVVGWHGRSQPCAPISGRIGFGDLMLTPMAGSGDPPHEIVAGCMRRLGLAGAYAGGKATGATGARPIANRPQIANLPHYAGR